MDNVEIAYTVGSIAVSVLIGYWKGNRKYQAVNTLINNSEKRLQRIKERLSDGVVTAKELKDTAADMEATVEDIKNVVT